MNTMKALLWKELRVNRTALILAMSILLFPYVVGGALTAIAEHRWGAQVWWGESMLTYGFISLALSLVSVCILAGNAFAGERADRTAEFFAYLPPAAWERLVSKLAVALGAVLFVWLVNMIVIYGIAPQLPFQSDGLGSRGGKDVQEQIPMMTGIAVAVFGAAWLASSMMSSHLGAAACGVALPIFIVCGLRLCEYWFEWQDFAFWRWYAGLCISAGILCFAAGTVYYLRRVEP